MFEAYLKYANASLPPTDWSGAQLEYQDFS